MRLSTGLNSLYFVFHLLLIGLSIAKIYSLRGITLFDRLNLRKLIIESFIQSIAPEYGACFRYPQH